MKIEILNCMKTKVIERIRQKYWKGRVILSIVFEDRIGIRIYLYRRRYVSTLFCKIDCKFKDNLIYYVPLTCWRIISIIKKNSKGLLLKIATKKVLSKSEMAYWRIHASMTALWITRYILRTSAIRTNEFELARGSPSICLEARIWLTLDEFSFGENLCFRHWREMARTDALFAHKFLTSKVQNVGGEGEEGGKSRRPRGKVANFTKARALHPSIGVCVWARGELMMILFTILLTVNARVISHNTLCKIRINYFIMSPDISNNFVTNIMSYIIDWTCLITNFFMREIISIIETTLLARKYRSTRQTSV